MDMRKLIDKSDKRDKKKKRERETKGEKLRNDVETSNYRAICTHGTDDWG